MTRPIGVCRFVASCAPWSPPDEERGGAIQKTNIRSLFLALADLCLSRTTIRFAREAEMPKVTDAYRVARRDEIIDAALRCFAEKGYQRTSMADVIDEPGLSAGAIYGHFAGKKELFAAVAGRVLEPAVPSSRRDERRSGCRSRRARSWPTLLDGHPSRAVQRGHRATLGRGRRRPRDPRARAGRASPAFATRCGRDSPSGPPPNPVASTGDPPSGPQRQAPVVLGLAPGFMIQRAIAIEFDEDEYIAAIPERSPLTNRADVPGALTTSARCSSGRQMPCHAGLFAQACR